MWSGKTKDFLFFSFFLFSISIDGISPEQEALSLPEETELPGVAPEKRADWLRRFGSAVGRTLF